MTAQIFKALMDIVLASGSPRRKQFLDELGFHFRVIPSTALEPVPLPSEKPEEYVLRTARIKATDVAAREPSAVVIGADTIVVLNGEIMGKPINHAHALAMLQRLSGATHTVFTACVVLFPNGREESEVVGTQVTMARYDDEILRAYAHTGEPDDKAGSYAVQGTGAFLIKNIHGSWTNVVGLPVTELLHILLAHGCITPVMEGYHE